MSIMRYDDDDDGCIKAMIMIYDDGYIKLWISSSNTNKAFGCF